MRGIDAQPCAQDVKAALFIAHDIAEAVLLSDEVVVVSHRPGRVLRRFPAPFARPRSPALRREAGFHRMVGEIHAPFRETGIL